MTRCKYYGCDDQWQGPAHDPAKQKQNGRDDGERKCPKNTARLKADHPNDTINRYQYSIHDQI